MTFEIIYEFPAFLILNLSFQFEILALIGDSRSYDPAETYGKICATEEVPASVKSMSNKLRVRVH